MRLRQNVEVSHAARIGMYAYVGNDNRGRRQMTCAA